MIEMRGHESATRRRTADAVHDQEVGAHLVRHAVGREAGGDTRQPIAFLGAQFGETQHVRRALGAGRGDSEDRIFVDHGRRALGRHGDALQAAATHAQIGDRLAAHLARVLEHDVRTHFLQGRIKPGPQGIQAHVLDRHVAAGEDARGHDGEGGRRRIARHDDVAALQLGPADDGDALATTAFKIGHAHLGAEMAQHAFGMIARGLRFDHRGLARGVEAGQQDAALHLGRRDRQGVFDRHHFIGADDAQRHAAAVARHEARAHALQRFDHALHRPAAQRAVAGHETDEGVAGQDARQQPCRSTRVAQIEHVARLLAAADAKTTHPPDRAFLHDLRAERPQRRGRAQHVLAFQQAGNHGFAQRQGAKHQRPVRYGLVSRGPDPAFEAGNLAGNQFGRDGLAGQGMLHLRQRALVACRNLVLTG